MNGTKSILREPVTAKAGQGDEQQCQGETKKDPESQPGVYSLGGYSGGKGGAAQLSIKRKRRDFVPVQITVFPSVLVPKVPSSMVIFEALPMGFGRLLPRELDEAARDNVGAGLRGHRPVSATRAENE